MGKKYFLSVVGIFKNEGQIIEEWIQHYLNEGVDHFYLINNGSTDDYLSKIQEYIDSETITLIHDDQKWAQVELYNKYILPKKKSNEWLMIVDLDEFIYARNGYKTIKEYLKSRSRRTSMIRIAWKMFGSNAYRQQPLSAIKGFTKRSVYSDQIEHPGMKDESHSTSKVIVRTKYLKWLNIHECELKKWRKGIIEDANGQPISMEDPYHQPINEDLLANASLHLNHYAIQSYDWFMEVKATRGAADTVHHEKDRDIKYFEKYDATTNELSDCELAEKSY